MGGETSPKAVEVSSPTASTITTVEVKAPEAPTSKSAAAQLGQNRLGAKTDADDVLALDSLRSSGKASDRQILQGKAQCSLQNEES